MTVIHSRVRDAKKTVQSAAANHLTIVFCSMPTCGHCLAMAKPYEELAAEFYCCREIKMVKVDSAADPDIPEFMAQWIKKPRAPGYPMFYAFVGREYKATRPGSSSKEALREWIMKQGVDCSMCAPGTK